LKHCNIRRFEEDTEDESTKSNKWQITKLFTKHHTPVIHSRWELTYTSLNKATANADVYEDQIRSNPEE
jgi:hypothetical protein